MLHLIIVQLITIGIFIFILRILFYKQLNKALGRLNTSLQNNLGKEKELKDRMQQTEDEKEVQISKGKEEAKEIVEVAKKEAEQIRSNVQGQAKKQAELIVQKGQQKTEKLKRDISSQIETQALELSLEMIKHTFSQEGKESLHHKFIKEVIQEINQLDSSKFSVKAKTVVVKTAALLDESEKTSLKKILSKKLGASCQLKEQINSELIAGLILQIDSLIIDGSLQNRLKKVIPYLKRK